MSYIQESELLKLRELGNNNPQNLREVASRIFDKKLRSFLVLDTKEEVLHQCQEILINKTIDYMNVITELQTSQLKSLNSLNNLLDDKTSIIHTLNKSIFELNDTKKRNEDNIASLNSEVDALKRDLSDAKLRHQNELMSQLKITSDLERANKQLRVQFFEAKSTLETQNKDIQKSLQEIVEEKKETSAALKTDISNLRVAKDREAVEANKKLREMFSQFQKTKEDLHRDKKYLQDLVEVKDDEIKALKKPRKIFRIEHTSELIIRPLDRLEKYEKGEENRTRALSKSKKTDKPKRQEETIRGDVADFGMQCEVLKGVFPKTPRINRTDRACQTVVENPLESLDEVGELEIKMKEYLDDKYRTLYDQKAKFLGDKYKDSFMKALTETRYLINSLTLLTRDQLQLGASKYQQMEQVYEARPSREQDLHYICELIEENRSLVALCKEANRKTDSAYQAMQEYHLQLESYKKMVPINIVGALPPQIHTSRERLKDGVRSQSYRQYTFNQTCISRPYSVWGTSEPSTSRKPNRTKVEEETLEGTTLKDILITDLESTEFGSPVKRKTLKTRPQTGRVNSILSARGVPSRN